MKYGIYFFPTDLSLHPAELGSAVEAAGFESLWFPDHSHIPLPETLPARTAKRVASLPKEYWRTYDQFIALAAISSVTSSLRLGTAISLVPQRDPLWMAKEVASLDVLSGGRVSLGVGYGWIGREFEHHGRSFADKREIMKEHLEAMFQLWKKEIASYEGRFVSFGKSWAWPKPKQQPYPPIHMGAPLELEMLEHLVAYCQGWIPPNTSVLDQVAMDTVRFALNESGRDPTTFEVSRFGVKPHESVLDQLEVLGVARSCFTIQSRTRDEVFRDLDHVSKIVESYEGT